MFEENVHQIKVTVVGSHMQRCFQPFDNKTPNNGSKVMAWQMGNRRVYLLIFTFQQEQCGSPKTNLILKPTIAHYILVNSTKVNHKVTAITCHRCTQTT